MHPKDLSIKDYTYFLPEERIAAYPLPDRAASKLLIYQEGKISQDIYSNLADHIPGNSLLIFNNSKVIEARLLFQKPSGGTIEIFCLEPHPQYGAMEQALLQKEKVVWQCLVGGVSKWKHGQSLEKRFIIDEKEILLRAVIAGKMTDHFMIAFSWSPVDYSFAEILHAAGTTPLPPYIKRAAEESDSQRYQTVYARPEGSVAAPTAGLHFTEAVFEKLKAKNNHIDFVTLHVGAGTFKPVKSETLADHEMHAEFIDVSLSTIETIFKNLSSNIIAIGTTSLRTVESLYWLGIKTKLNPSILPSLLHLSQWEVYDPPEMMIPVKDSLLSLFDWMERNKLQKLVTRTQILIAPGYQPKIINALVTNFHQTRSTLLMLVAAFIGNQWKNVYDFALENDFRFLSYGDGSLLWYKKIKHVSMAARQ